MFARAYHPTGNGLYWDYGELVVAFCVVWVVLRDPPCATKWESGLSIFCFLVRTAAKVALPIITHGRGCHWMSCHWDGFIISTTASIWERHEEAQLRHDLVCDGGLFGISWALEPWCYQFVGDLTPVLCDDGWHAFRLWRFKGCEIPRLEWPADENIRYVQEAAQSLPVNSE